MILKLRIQNPLYGNVYKPLCHLTVLVFYVTDEPAPHASANDVIRGTDSESEVTLYVYFHTLVLLIYLCLIAYIVKGRKEH